MSENASISGFVRLQQIVGPDGLIPIGRSTWWAGVRAGRFPAPVKLGPRTTAWRRDDIDQLLRKFERLERIIGKPEKIGDPE